MSLVANKSGAKDHLSLPTHDRGKQLGVLVWVVFEVRVLNEDNVTRGVRKTGTEGCPFTSIGLMIDDLDGPFHFEPIEQFQCSVCGTVIHDYDLAFHGQCYCKDPVKNGLDCVDLIETG